MMKEANMERYDRSSWPTTCRSILRLKIVGLFCLLGALYWLQAYHFQFGMEVHDAVKPATPHVMVDTDDDDFSVDQVPSGVEVDDEVDEVVQGTNTIDQVTTPAPTPCPFLSPKVTGRKKWTLYPKEAYNGLTLLRPRKESILMTGFPGCVPFVLRKQKLLLFTVLKVSSTVFTQVAKRLDGNPSWPNACGNVQNPLLTNLTYLTDLPPQNAEKLLLDPSWTKAIFVRDPKERVLSAYLNKAVGEPTYIKARCCDQKSNDVHALLECDNPDSLPVISFHDFLHVILPQCRDGHWCRQSDLMRPDQWKQINFVGHFDRLAEDSRHLLDNVLGVWDEMGATGWPHGSLYAGSSTVHHQTGAHDRLRQYYTPELEAFADDWYKADYDSPFLGLAKYRLF